MGVRAIADRAQVSITTVSRVLNNHSDVSYEARERVLAAINKEGYKHSVGRKSFDNIAYVYTGDFWLGAQFESAVLSGASGGLREAGYDLMILEAARVKQPKETYTQMFMRKGVRGAILRTTAQSRGVCEAIANEGFPAIVVADRFDNPRVNYIYTDSRECSQEAVEYLISLGHKRIAISLNVIDDSDHDDRHDGYRKALTDHGIEIDPKLVVRTPANREGGASVIQRLMTLPNRPTAVFFTDPMTAVAALSAARKLGVSVPNDLSIVGFDDNEIRYQVFPELTAVCQNADAIGREAVEALVGMVDPAKRGKTDLPWRKTLRSWLHVGASTVAPPSLGH